MECVCLHARTGVRAGGGELVHVLEEINMGLWLGNMLSGKTAGLSSLFIGKALTFRGAPSQCKMWETLCKMCFWKELCSSSKFTTSLSFVANFNPLLQLFSHLRS